MEWLFFLILVGIIVYSVLFSKSLNNQKENESENPIAIMEETIKKAKKDLETGVKREELDELLKRGHITQDVYNETIQSIEMLETLANWDITEIKNNLNNNNKDN